MKLLKAITICVLLTGFITLKPNAQNTTITDDVGYTANPSAMLDVKSLDKGFLVPRVTTLQMNAIVMPANGLLVYNTDLKSFCYRADNKWIVLASQLVPQSAGITDALFHVVNASGDTVFAVYPEGVRINVGNGLIKGSGNKGGFAIGGLSGGKSGLTEFLRVTPDSVRIYIDTSTTKGSGNKGGFAIGGLSGGKSVLQDYLKVTRDSVRVYINDNPSKGSGNKGGFAIGGLSGGKTGLNEFLYLTKLNYFIGHESGLNNISGLHNSFFGYQTGKMNSSGSYNVFLGYQSGYSNTTGSWNSFMGYQSGYSNTTGLWNVFIGYESGYKNTIGQRNVSLGYLSGYSNIDGTANVYLGYASGYSATSGGGNLFAGEQSGYYNNGSWNTFLGALAGRNSYSSNNNVFIGAASGSENTSGWNNVFVGNNAGLNNTGSDNVFLGNGAGTGNYEANTGERNVCIGTRAGAYITGSDNIFIGYNAGFNTTGSNKLIIHNNPVTLPLIYGEFNNRKIVFNSKVTIDRFLALNDTAQELSSNGAIQPYTSYIKVYSTSDVTLSDVLSIADGSVIGQVIMIQNTGAYNITVKNNANTKLGGVADKTLGKNDMLMLIWDGDDWIQYSYSDN